MIVTLEPKADAAAVAQAHGVNPRHIYRHALNGFAGALSEAARSGLLRDGRVVRVEPDAPIHVDETIQPNPTWGLDRIDQRMLPIDKAYAYRYTGEGVTAYIIDSGIRFDHVDFGGRAVRGFDAIADGRNGSDCRGHGSHVAGTVGGGTWGVAKNVRLVAVRVLDCNGNGTVSGAIAGIEWVIANNRGPGVATLSLGAAKNESLNQAVRNLVNAGVQVAVAAGNSDMDACNFSPASTAEAVTVGAAGTAHINDRQPFSNWGNCLDVFAPGASITSVSHLDATSSAVKSGTSMAAPHVAGVMALWLQEDPYLTTAQLHQLIVAHATQNIVINAKSVNAHMLHSLRDATAPVSNAAPRAVFTASCVDLSCAFDASASSDADGSIARYDWTFGDGATGSGRLVSRTYSAAGSYGVSLTVTDDKGGAGTYSITVSPLSPTSTTAPAAPTTLAARLPALNRVELSWTDRSNSELGFQVERRIGSGDFVRIAQTVTNVTTYSDTSVQRDQNYTYRVRAYNLGGSSGYSNEVSITVSCRTKRNNPNCQ